MSSLTIHRLIVAIIIMVAAFSFTHQALAQEATSNYATMREWYQMLDTTFHWEDLGLSERDVPDAITDPSLRRAYALGLAYVWPTADESYFDGVLQYYRLENDMLQLFFHDAVCFTWEPNPNYDPLLGEVKWRLRFKFNINLDSLESVTRNGAWNYNTYAGWDSVSVDVVDAFAAQAAKFPLMSIPAMEWTTGDSVRSCVNISGNVTFSGFSLKLGTYLPGEFISNAASDHFTTAFGFNGGSGCDGSYYGIAGYGAPYHLNGTATLVNMTIEPYGYGKYFTYQKSAMLSDTLGLHDLPVWAMSVPWTFYERSDINQDFNVTIADVVRFRWLLLRDELPALEHLGDANYNGVRDLDDLYQLLMNVVYHWQPKAVRKQNSIMSAGDTTNGYVQVTPVDAGEEYNVAISFHGNVGQAKRFGSKIIFDPSLQLLEVNFPGHHMADLSGWRISGDTINVMRFDSSLTAGNVLVQLKFKKLGTGADISLEPMLYNYFSFGEEVEVEYASPTSVGEGKLPGKFKLDQNYPNPFNPTTVISYTLPKEAQVRLEVFNLLGQRMAILVDLKQEAGEHVVRFDASALPSGVYTYRLKVGEFVETKKMLLAK